MTMFFFPTVINIFIFWITDNFLMRNQNQKIKKHVTIEHNDADSDQELLQENNDNQSHPSV